MNKSTAAAPKAPRPFEIPFTQVNAAEITAEIDELGRLEQELLPVEPKLKRVDALRKSIRAKFDAMPADQSIEAPGEKYVALLGARAVTKLVNLAKLFKAVGPKRFVAMASVTLAAMERGEVDAATRDACVTEERTGIRSLKVYPRG